MFNKEYIISVLKDEEEKDCEGIYRNDHKTFVEDSDRHIELITEHLKSFGLIDYRIKFRSYNLIVFRFTIHKIEYKCLFYLGSETYELCVLEDEPDIFNEFISKKQEYNLLNDPNEYTLPQKKKYHKNDIVLYENKVCHIVDYQYTNHKIFYLLNTIPKHYIGEDEIISLMEGI